MKASTNFPRLPHWCRLLLVGCLLAVAPGVWIACAPDGCKTSVDCQGAFCLEGKCVECTTDEHCKDAKRCQSGQCTTPEETPSSDSVGPTDAGDEPVVTVDAAPDEEVVDVIQPPADDEPVDFQLPEERPVGPPPAVCAGRTNCCVPTSLQLFSAAETVTSALFSYRPMIAWSSDGAVFASATMNAGRVEVRNGTTFAYTRAWTAHAAGILGMALDSTGTLLATASYDRTVKIWTVADGKLKWELKGHGSYVYDVAFSQDGKRVVSSGIYDYTARVWDVATGKLVGAPLKDSQYVYSAAFTGSSNQVVLVGANKLASLWDVTTGKKIRSFAGNTSNVRSVDVSADGARVVVAGDDRNARIYEVSTGKLLQTLSGHTAPIYRVRFSPDGKLVATAGSYDFTARIWQASNGALVETFKDHAIHVTDLAWSADSQKILTATYAKWVRMWTLGSQTPRKVLDLHYDVAASLAIHPAGTHLVAAEVASKTAQLIRLSDYKVIATLTGHTSYISNVAFSKDGKSIATSSWDKTVKIWNAATGQLVRTLTGHTGAVYGLAISPNSDLVASGSSDQTIRITNLNDGKLIRTLSGHKGAVHALDFSHDGKWLASGSSDTLVKLWQVSNGANLKTMTGHRVSVFAVAFNKNSSRLASGGWDRAVFLWNMPEGVLERSTVVQNGLIRQLAFLPDDRLALVSYDLYVRIYKTPELVRSHALRKHPSMITGLAIHPTQPIVYSVGFSGAIYGWRIDQEGAPETLSLTPLSLTVTPDNQWAIIGTEEGMIEIRGVQDGKLVKTLEGHTGAVRAVALSIDGKTLFSASDDTTIRAWKLEDGSLLQTFKGHTERVYGLSVHPDGKSIASGGFDEKVKQWDIATGKLLRDYVGAVGRVYAVAFSPSGKMLAAGTYDKQTVYIWNEGDTQLSKSLLQSGTRGGVTALAWWDDTYLFAAYYDSYIRQWRMSTGTLHRNLLGHDGPVLSLTLRGNGDVLTSSSSDGTVRNWYTSDGLNENSLKGHNGQVNAVADAGGTILSIGEDKTLRRWQALLNPIVDALTLTGASTSLGDVGLSPDGKWAATAGLGGRARHYAASAGKHLRAVISGSNPITAVAFSHQSDKYAAATVKYAYVWNATNTSTAERLNTITTDHKTGPTSLVFSSDASMLLASINESNAIQRFRLKDNKLDGEIVGHTKPVFRLAMDSAGKYLLSASHDQTIRLWDGTSWAPVRTVADLGGTLVSADLSSDASYIAAVIGPGTLKLLKLDGTLHQSLTSKVPITRARFGGSGAWIALGYTDGSVKIYSTYNLTLLQQFNIQSLPVTALDAAVSGNGLIAGNTAGYSIAWRCQ